MFATPVGYFCFYHQDQFSRSLVATACVGFVVGTLLFSPDLDLRNSTPTRNWGLFQFLWRGYHRFFKHRGYSHSFIFSSVTKLMYFLGVISILVIFCVFIKNLFGNSSLDDVIQISKQDILELTSIIASRATLNKKYIFSWIIGVILSDWFHIFLDKGLTFGKRVTRYFN